MPRTWMRRGWRTFCMGCMLLLAIVLAACGGAGTSAPSAVQNAAGSSAAPNPNSDSSQNPVSAGSASSAGDKSSPKNVVSAPQYLIKALKVSIEVPDTKKAADEVQSWISTTDPHSTSAGISYDQAGDNTFNISMTFSVSSSVYPQIQRYLRDYGTRQDDRLLGFSETVQDVTNDYVDTDARLKTLHTEQSRLLTFMSNAQSLSDMLALEQRLTDVETQIESIQSHLNLLNNQVSFYTVSVTFQPPSSAVVQPPPSTGWSLGQVLHDAWAASLSFGQGLLTIFVWLLAFAIYVVPVALLTWFVVIWRARAERMRARPVSPPFESVSRPAPPAPEPTPPVTSGASHE